MANPILGPFLVFVNGDTGALIDFGYMDLVPGTHYTIDSPECFDPRLGPVYINSVATPTKNNTTFHSGGEWIYTKSLPESEPTPEPTPDLYSLVATLQLELTVANNNISALADALSTANTEIAKLKESI